MKYLYKYPQAEYPYKQLVQESVSRDREAREFEILDTDVFDENRYWDIIIEYAKDDENETETLIRVWATNHGPESASLTSSRKQFSAIRGPGAVLMRRKP